MEIKTTLLNKLFQRKINSETGKYLRFDDKHTANANLRGVVTKTIISGKFVALNIIICKRWQNMPREYRECVSNDIENKYTVEKINCQRLVLWK